MVLPMRKADPASDCGRAEQLFLSALPAGAQRFCANTSLAYAEEQAAEKVQ